MTERTDQTGRWSVVHLHLQNISETSLPHYGYGRSSVEWGGVGWKWTRDLRHSPFFSKGTDGRESDNDDVQSIVSYRVP